MSLHPFLESACRKLDHQAVVLSEDGDKLHEKDDFLSILEPISFFLFLLRFFAMTSTINVAAATALMFAESAILLIQN